MPRDSRQYAFNNTLECVGDYLYKRTVLIIRENTPLKNMDLGEIATLLSRITRFWRCLCATILFSIHFPAILFSIFQQFQMFFPLHSFQELPEQYANHVRRKAGLLQVPGETL